MNLNIFSAKVCFVIIFPDIHWAYPMLLYSKVSPIVFSEAYSEERMHTIADWQPNPVLIYWRKWVHDNRRYSTSMKQVANGVYSALPAAIMRVLLCCNFAAGPWHISGYQAQSYGCLLKSKSIKSMWLTTMYGWVGLQPQYVSSGCRGGQSGRQSWRTRVQLSGEEEELEARRIQWGGSRCNGAHQILSLPFQTSLALFSSLRKERIEENMFVPSTTKKDEQWTVLRKNVPKLQDSSRMKDAIYKDKWNHPPLEVNYNSGQDLTRMLYSIGLFQKSLG